jgi:hypothetical protein
LEFIKHEDKIVSDLINMTNKKKVEEITRNTYDLGFSSLLPYEILHFKSLDLPVVTWQNYLPEPITSVVNGYPWDMSSGLPSFNPSSRILQSFGHKSVFNRAIENAIGNVFYYVYHGVTNVFYSQTRFNTEEKSAFIDRLQEDHVVGDGFHGIRDSKQEA